MQVPGETEVLGWMEELSNWGRWGLDDRLGTLNHVTDDVRVAAAREVSTGRSVSLAWDIDTSGSPEQHAGPPQRYMITHGQGLGDEGRILPAAIAAEDRQAGAHEYLGLVFHGFGITHLDALSHIMWDGKLYNGRPAEEVTSHAGAVSHDVTGLAEGIMTRGVLVDVPRYRGVDWLEPTEGVGPEELEAALEAQGTEVRPGDAILLRTGYGRRKRERGPEDVAALGRAGWHAACMPWFHRHDTAMIGADTAQEVIPSGYQQLRIPVHTIGLVAMGLYLLDNCDLEDLAAACQDHARWSFHLTVAPLRWVGSTGSPVNPIATF